MKPAIMKVMKPKTIRDPPLSLCDSVFLFRIFIMYIEITVLTPSDPKRSKLQCQSRLSMGHNWAAHTVHSIYFNMLFWPLNSCFRRHACKTHWWYHTCRSMPCTVQLTLCSVMSFVWPWWRPLAQISPVFLTVCRFGTKWPVRASVGSVHSKLHI